MYGRRYVGNDNGDARAGEREPGCQVSVFVVEEEAGVEATDRSKNFGVYRKKGTSGPMALDRHYATSGG